MAYDARLTSDVLNVFIRALFGELQRRAHELLGLRSSQCGAVTFVQRYGDALNANVHFHCLVIDGVYAAGEDGRPEFCQLPAPEDDDVLRLTMLVSQKIQSLLERRGCGTEADTQQADPLSQDDPGMAALLANSVRRRIAAGSNAGRGVVRLGDQIDGRQPGCVREPPVRYGFRGGRMKILAAIHPPDATAKILECLGQPSRAPPLASAVSDFNCQMDSF